jgi:EAL domain-containing protein (putative c-di-GMP-specific phosphodiesterase class I)
MPEGADWNRAGECAISIDEIGVQTARIRNFQLRSFYQPIFQCHRHSLEICAVEHATKVFRAGEPCGDQEFLASLNDDERQIAKDADAMLETANFSNMGLEGLGLLMRCAANDGAVERRLADFRGMNRMLGELGLAAPRFGCAMLDLGNADVSRVEFLAETLRTDGVLVALDNFGDEPRVMEVLPRIAPDIVRISARFFADICRNSATISLFRALVGTMRNDGITVLVKGIENADQLRIALGAGADQVQGRFLADFAPVGSDMDEGVLDIDEMLGGRKKLVPFRY